MSSVEAEDGEVPFNFANSSFRVIDGGCTIGESEDCRAFSGLGSAHYMHHHSLGNWKHPKACQGQELAVVFGKHKDFPQTNLVVQLLPHSHKPCRLGGSILVQSSTQGKIDTAKEDLCGPNVYSSGPRFSESDHKVLSVLSLTFLAAPLIL